MNWNKEGLHLSQGQYVENLLRSFDMINVKPSITPMVPNVDLSTQAEVILETREYR